MPLVESSFVSLDQRMPHRFTLLLPIHHFTRFNAHGLDRLHTVDVDLADRINLRLILVSGKTREYLFSPNDSASDIAQYVFDNWAEAEWAEESVAKAEILRLIYQGRFLHGNVTLGALQLPLGRTTVMHLVPRENLPEPNSQDQRQKSKDRSSNCCSASCSIL
ncbi:ubiquitin-like protein 3 [Trichonephila inaurata madagascariensis]|uniref:Ubiquitin-like protein 3 n=1 Tax=Trichonephila inaurata madagascariensis TaxID=2747483 RepID=A0A8X6X1S0_9ARAC|nr:ubiquitin-like protein 3 [Trichonephila inaurata madagascariensis]